MWGWLDHSFSEVKILKASVGLGQGSNNFVELKAFHLLLSWLILRDVREVQLFGDSMNVVQWFNGTHHCHNLTLLPLFKEASWLRNCFMEISISHIFRERNSEADRISKEGVAREMGLWTVSEVDNGSVRHVEQPIFA